jgi:hypothetical protein
MGQPALSWWSWLEGQRWRVWVNVIIIVVNADDGGVDSREVAAPFQPSVS